MRPLNLIELLPTSSRSGIPFSRCRAASRLGGLCLLAAFAVAAMLPAEAGAKTQNMGGGYALEYSSHPSEGDDGNYKLKITNSNGKNFPHSINCRTEDSASGGGFDAAKAGTDYTGFGWTRFTFDTSSSEPAVTISTIENDKVEGTERYKFRCDHDGNNGSRYLKIIDDDKVTMTVNNASVSEGGTMTFTVTHTGQSTDSWGFNVTPSYSNGTAESGDYTTNTNALSFSGTKDETQTFTVSTTQDAVFETNETFTVSLSISGSSIPREAPTDSKDTGTGTINNDDSATVTVNDASASEGDAITFTITLDNAVEGGVTVTPDFTDVSAVEGTDYTENTTAIDFDGNANETQTFTVSTTEDTYIEDNETFTVGLSTSNAPSGVTSSDTGTGTINDDETKPYVVVNSASVDEGDSGTTDMTFTARLVNSNGHTLSSKQTVTAGYSVLSETGNTATAGTDYTTKTGTITFAPDETSKTIDVSVTGDETVEADETLTWKWTSWTNSILASYTYTGTIKNDDKATVTINDATASEGADMTFTVTLSEAVQGGLKVTPSYTNSSAESGDYTANTTTLTFTGTKGETQTFTVSTTEDAVLEGNETFTVGLSVSDAPSGVTYTDTGTGTITDDDSAAVSVNDASASEGESMTFTVTLSAAVEDGLTVTPSYTNSSAESGDYTANTTALTFTGTKDETQTFSVSTAEDAVFEGNETFTVGLSVSDAPSDVTSTDTGTGTITDDDSATVTVNDANADEGDSMTFTVTLSAAVEDGLTVTPSYTNSSAESGDYTANTTALTFTGTKDETKTFSVSTAEDAVLEANETFTVGLSVSDAPTGTTVTSSDTGTGTINNDDDSATVTVNDASASEGESMTFTVTLSAAVQGGLTVTPSYTDGTTASGDYTANTTALTFTGTKDETKTFSVSTAEDAVLEANETFTVGLSVSDAPSGVTSSDTGTGTVNNDDSATVTVNDASASEGESMTFTVTLSEAVQGGLTVTPSYTDGTTASGDYTANTTALTFTGTKDETKTFSVSTAEDAVFEGDETFTVGLSVSGAPSGVTSSDTGTGTVNNDDSATVTVNDASASEGESMTFTVTLSEAVQGGLTVTPSFTDGTAVEGTDYAENTSALSFSGTKGETKTFTVSTTEEANVEGNETFTVGLSVSNAPSGVTSTDTGTGTINNDDSSSVTINDASASEGESMTFTVTLSEAVQGGLTVTPSFTDGTAVEGTDYDENTSGLSFTGTKDETKTFTVSTTEDAVLEGNETFTVGLSVSNAPSGVTDTDTGTGTVNNDDSATVTINDASASEGESMTFTVTLSEAVQGGLTVTPSFTDVTAVEGTDYDENTSGLSFTGTKGETKTFTVSTTEETNVEGNETFTVGLSVSNAPNGITSSDTGTGTINNDDSSSITIDDASASEGESMTFTVTLSEAVQGGLTVTPSFTDVTAVEGTDYDENTTALSFSGTKGETQTFTVSTTEEAVLEHAETFTVSLSVSNAPNGITATDTGTGTINNDDSATVTIDDVSASEGESMTFTVTLSEAVQGGLTVTPGFTDVTAVEGTDYDENTSALSFSGTKGETQTFTVSTTEEAVVEYAETFTVSLSVSNAPSGVTSSDTGTGTINNDDSAEVSVNDASVAESGAMTFTVTLSEAVQGGVTVTPGYTDGTTTSSDYTANTTALNFSGTKSETQSFTVSTTADAVVEGNETFTVSLSISNAPPGVTVAGGGSNALGKKVAMASSGGGTGTILNDDSAEVTIGDASAEEGDAITFTLTLDAAVQGGLTVTPSYPDGLTLGLVKVGTDYTANTAGVSFTGTVGETQTFTVSTTEDTYVESDETFTVSLSVSGAPAGVTSSDTGTGTIDDDEVKPYVRADFPSVQEGDSGTTILTFGVRLTFEHGQTVGSHETITAGYEVYTASGYTATPGVDYTATNGTLTFAPGEISKTVAVSVIGDTAVEGDEVLAYTWTSTTNSVVALSTYTGTITDDDYTALTIGAARIDEGGDLTFTVTLDKAVQGGLTVTPTFTDVTAVEGTDYDANTTALSFSGTSGETETLTVSTLADADVEGDETFTVGLSVSKGPRGMVTTGTGTGTILNDDSATVTIDDASADEGDGMTFTVTLDKAVVGGLTVTPSFTDDTATQGSDYTANTTALAFSGTAGETQTFTVSTTEDAVLEGDETFTVGLSVSNSNATASGTGTGTITDDDGATVTIGDASTTEGGALTFTVTLDQAVAGGLTVTPTFTDGTATQGSDYTANTTALAFTGTANESHSFTVSTTDDGVVESDETFTVGLSASHAGVTASASATGTIQNDDVRPTVTVSGPDTTQQAPFNVSIDFSTSVTGFEQSDLGVSNGSVTSFSGSGADYAATITPVAANSRVDVTVAADAAHDSAGNGNEGSAQFSVQIIAVPTPPSPPDEDPSSPGDDPPANDPPGDDPPVDATVSISNASADEGDSMTFTVTLDKAVAGGLTVTPSFTDGTAVQGSDYTANTTALSFTGTAGESHPFTVDTTDDAVLEGDETFTVGLSVSDASVTATDTGTGTIDDDDSAAVSVSDASATEGSSLTFTVTLDKAVAGGLTVTPSFTDGTATDGSDYTANTTGLHFTGTAGESHSFSVSTTQDVLLEAAETFTVGLSASHAGVTATDTGTGTINDDDRATVSVSDASATEGSSMTFTVTLDRAVAGGLTVTPSFTDSTAVDGSDYTANTTGLSFTGTAGESQTFSVSTTQDALLEAAETFTVSLSVSGTSVSVTATDTGTGTINDDDRATVSVSDASATEGSSLTFTVSLDRAVTGGLTVTPSFTDGTATQGSDYAANTSALSFAGTAGESQTFSVSTTQDALLEAAETFTVGLSVSGTSVSVTATATGTGTINDDDRATVSVSDASATEGSSLTFTVSLDQAVAGGLTVTPSFTDSTATQGRDYTANTTGLSFTGTAGESQTFSVSTTDDAVLESAETFTVSLSASHASVTATDTGTGTIDDGDQAAVSVSDASATEGSSMTFTVTLDQAVAGGLTVTPSFTDGTATQGSDYTANTTALSFTGTAGESQTFSVSTTDDAVLEAAETFTVGLSASHVGVTATDTGTGTIDDGDQAAVSVSDASATEGSSITFTVSLDQAVAGGLTVTPSFTDGTAVQGRDYTANTTGLSFAGTAGESQTFTVATTDDAVLEAAETFTVGLRASHTGVTATDTGTGTIDDGDQAAVSVSDASATEGGSMTFTVTLDQTVAGGLTVTPSFTDGTATQGRDYTANATGLSFAGTAGESQTFTVATTDDAVLESAETFTVGLSASHVGVTATDTGTGTIDDDDQAAVSVSDASATEGSSMTFTVTLDQAVQGGLTVTPSFNDGTAMQGSDYTANTAPLSFIGTAGESQTFTVATTDDGAVESHETFTVGLRASPAGVTATDTGIGTIQDDDVRPIVVVSGPTTVQNDAFAVSVIFSTSVTGFEQSDLSVGNGSASGLSGLGANYTATITPAASGSVTVAVAENVAHDSGGNGNQAAVPFSVQADVDAPTVSLSGPQRVQGIKPFDVSIAFSESVTGFELSDLSVGNGSASGLSGSGGSYTATVTPAALGTATVSVAAEVAHDAAGNGNQANQPVTIVIRDENEPLAAPEVTEVTGVSTTSLLVAWTAPSTAAGAPISDYEVRYRLAVSGAVFTDVGYDGTDTTATLAGLQLGTTYEVQVRAHNDEGTSPWSAPDTGTTHANTAPTFADGSDRLVAENTPAGQPIGAPVAATDVDGDALTYALAGEDAAAFALDADSGQVRTKAALDYETRTTYAVMVEVSDGQGGTARLPVMIEVTDENEPPRDENEPLAAPEVTEVTGVSTTSLLVAWMAPSTAAGAPISDYEVRYRLAVSGAVFTDVGYDGTDTTATLAGLQPGTAYEVQVRAHNDEGTSPWSAPGTGTTDENTVPTFADGSDRLVAENTPAGQPIGAPVAATDVDGDELTYALAGEDAAAFALDADSGQVRTKAALDYESRMTYAVMVEVSDGQGGTARLSVTIEVTDENEPPDAPDAPEVTGVSSTSLLVAWTALSTSGGPSVSNYDVQPLVADSRAGPTTLAGLQPSTTSTSGGPSVSNYDVQPLVADSRAGPTTLTGLQPSTASTAGRPPISDYDVQYRVADSGGAFTDAGYDGMGTATLAGLQPGTAYEVQVRAHNDEGTSPWSAPDTGTTHANTAPTFADGSDRLVAENTPAGQPIGAPVAATDVDGDELTYALAGEDAAAFALDADSGQVRTKAALDYETRTTYAVMVEVSDGQGGTARLPVMIEVTDENEPPDAPDVPTVTGVSSTSLLVAWTAPATSAGPSVSDYDVQPLVADSGAGPTTLAGLQPSTTSTSAGPSVSDYDVQPLVTASGASLTDASYDGTGPTTLTGLQLSTTSTAGRPPISDYDVQYRVADSGGAFTDAGYDGMGTTTLTGLQPGTAYEVQVRAHNDEGTSPWSAPGTGRTHENTAPTFVDSSAGSQDVGRSVAENTPAGQPIGVPVAATDVDGDALTYALAGEDAAAFALDADSGQVRTQAALDYETRTTYAVVVEVSDGQGETVRLSVTIAVTDENEPPDAPDAPTVTGASSTSLAVAWTAPSMAGGPSVSNYDVQPLVADSRAGPTTLAGLQPSTTSTSAGPSVSNYDVQPLVADSRAGPTTLAGLQLSTTSTAGRPPISDYDVQYRVADSGGAFTDAGYDGTGTTTLTGLQPGTAYEVQVRAHNDEGTSPWSAPGTGRTHENTAPTFVDSSAGSQDVGRSVAENTPAGQPIGAPVQATDVDGDALTYALAGEDAAAFALDADSGQVRTQAALDYESRTTYAVVVEVSDGQGETVRLSVTIAVIDENEPPDAPDVPTVTEVSSTSLAVAWSAPANLGPPISDYDVRYRLADSGGSFTDAGYDGTGTTTTLTGLQPDTAYEVQVRAHNDEGTSDWSALGTGRTHQNTAPAFTERADPSAGTAPDDGSAGTAPDDGSAGTAPDDGVELLELNISVSETLTVGQPLGASVQATDTDGDVLIYSLMGRDAGAFTINATTGQLRPLVALNHEGQATYAVIIKVSDGQGGTARLPVTITVTDEAEPPAAPDAPEVTGVSSTSLAVVWTVPANSGPPISDYDMRYRLADSGEGFIDPGYEGTGTAATLAGLRPDKAYEVQVRAHTDEGTSDWSALGTGRTHENTAPAFTELVDPSVGTTEGAGVELLELNISVSETMALGQPIDTLVLGTDADGDVLVFSLMGRDAGAFTIDATTGQLQPVVGFNHEGQTTFSVVIQVSDGQGGTARLPVTITVTDEAEPPDAPDAPTVTGVSPTGLAVAWSAPANLGPPISDYDVQYRVVGSGVAFIDAGYEGTGTTATLAGLLPDTVYEVYVRAHNDEGTSAWSDPGTSRTDKRPLVAPVLDDQMATAGTPFRYQFAAVDPPGAYAATQADGTGLPSWLHFDAATRTFEGTPVAAGTLSLDVTVSDGPDRSASATFALRVVQAAPVAAADEASVAEGSTVTIDVLANDTDFDGDRLSVHIVEETSHGVVEVQADGTVTYTHDGSETVGDQFRYRVHDGTTDSDAATVTIAVEAVNDAPTADAGADQVVAEEAAVQLSGSGTDPEGEVLTYIWTQISGATMALSDATLATPTFTAPTQLVSDAMLVFELVVTDASGAVSAADAVSITVEAGANDAPVFDAPYAFELAENEAGRPTPIALGHVSASDPEGEAVTYALAAGDASRFALDATSGELTYIGAGEDAEATEGYALTAQAADPHGASTSVEVWITIGNVDEPGAVTLSTSEPQIGQVVSAQLQDPDGAVANERWQWQRSADGSAWNAIAGATTDRYTPVLDDDGQRLQATVTYTDPARTSPLALASEATEPVQVATEDANRTRQLALAAVGRSVAEDVIEALNARMVAARHPESYLTINGQRTVVGRTESEGTPRSARTTAQQAAEQRRHPLDNSEFQLAIDETNELTLWGRGALNTFNSRLDEAATLMLNSQLGFGYLGVDYRRAGAATGVGMMLLRNQGTLDYQSTFIDKDNATLTLTNVLPYVHWRPKAGVDVWSLVGYGRGKVELFEDDPVRLRMGAVGLRYDLRSFGGVALAAKTDAFAVQLTPDEGYGSVARRLRLALESRLNWRVAAQASLQPMFELGVRWDGGDAAAGPGAELAGGVTYRHDRYGLQVEARGRRLLAHREDHVGLWGGSLMLRRQSQDRRGLQVALGPSWGEATSQVESLWRGGPLLGSARPGESWTPSELTLTGGYGLRLSAASRLTPFVEAGTGPMQRLRVGTRWEWTGAGSRRVELFGEQRRGLGTAPSRGIRIRGTLDL